MKHLRYLLSGSFIIWTDIPNFVVNLPFNSYGI